MSFAFHYSLQIISSLLKTERFNFFFFFFLNITPRDTTILEKIYMCFPRDKTKSCKAGNSIRKKHKLCLFKLFAGKHGQNSTTDKYQRSVIVMGYTCTNTRNISVTELD